MNLFQALLLGVVEGVTEFLPVSSTGHLTIAEKMLGQPIDDPGVTAFTALIQVGAILAVLLYFRHDIITIAGAWFRGLRSPAERRTHDYRMAWYVIVGSIPIAVTGFLGRHLISGSLRNLWVIVAALVGWSLFMFLAERMGAKNRGEADLNLKDAIVIGLVQCIALIPGVSRSGATISAGLFRNLDRVTATRLSFFLSIPALVAAGAYEGLSAASDISTTMAGLPPSSPPSSASSSPTQPLRGCSVSSPGTASPCSSVTDYCWPWRSASPSVRVRWAPPDPAARDPQVPLSDPVLAWRL